MEIAVTVGDVAIEPVQIYREAQYHPAPNWAHACHHAARALVVRALLLQEAVRLGHAAALSVDERSSQEAIARLTNEQLPVRPVTEAECRSFYEKNPSRFLGPELTDASHILFAVAADDELTREHARARAEQVLTQLRRAPEQFERRAQQHSACPSAASGGRLGQLTKGETVPEFEQALAALSPGELGLVETPHGVHVVRLNQRAPGAVLPYAAVADRIRIYLRDAAWRRALRHYVLELAGRFGVDGFDLDADPPAAADGAAQGHDPQPGIGRRRLPVLN